MTFPPDQVRRDIVFAFDSEYERVKQALLRRHDLDPEGTFDAETDAALLALDSLYQRLRNV